MKTRTLYVVAEKDENTYLSKDSFGDIDIEEDVLKAELLDDEESANDLLEEWYDSDFYADYDSDNPDTEWEVRKVRITIDLHPEETPIDPYY